MKLSVLVVSFVIVLFLSPLLAAAASETITITSPPANSFFAGPQPYTIRGIVSPVPQLADNVFISVQESGVAYPVDAQTVALQANGSFSYSTYMGGNSAWSNGTYVITAFDSSGSTASINFTFNTSAKVTSTPTTTSVTCSSYPITVGAADTSCTATVTDGSQTPAGTVTWTQSSGTGTLSFPDSTCNLSGGSCSVTVNGTGAGTAVALASYGGSPGFASSAGTSNTITISPATTTTIDSCSGPVPVGAASPCTATVSGAYGQISGETVSFTATGPGTFSAPNCVLSGNSCSVAYTPSSSSGSPQTITAAYPGDSNNLPSSGTTQLSVSSLPTTTLVSCASPVSVGQPSTCTINVAGSGAPTGTVGNFTSTGSGTFSASSCTLNGGSCQVSYTPSSISTSPDLISATYEGDSTNGVSTTAAANRGSITVVQATSSTYLSCGSPTGANVFTCTATVTGTFGPVSGESVSFTATGAGAFNATSCSLSGDACSVTYTTSSSSYSQQTITASYAGDVNNAASSGTAVVTPVQVTSTTSSTTTASSTTTTTTTTPTTSTTTNTSTSSTPPTTSTTTSTTQSTTTSSSGSNDTLLAVGALVTIAAVASAALYLVMRNRPKVKSP